jgi:hypothetical protein
LANNIFLSAWGAGTIQPGTFGMRVAAASCRSANLRQCSDYLVAPRRQNGGDAPHGNQRWRLLLDVLVATQRFVCLGGGKNNRDAGERHRNEGLFLQGRCLRLCEKANFASGQQNACSFVDRYSLFLSRRPESGPTGGHHPKDQNGAISPVTICLNVAATLIEKADRGRLQIARLERCDSRATHAFLNMARKGERVV